MKIYSPIFIVGVGRSGTSLLQSMLNAHSKISFPPETHYVKNYLSKCIDYAELKEKICQDQFLKNLDIDLSEAYKSSSGLVEFYEKILTSYSKKKKTVFIGDKDPNNIEYLKVLNKYFPNSVIVHIYRDPRSVVSSRRKAEWSRDKPLWQHLLAYKAQLNYYLSVKNKIKCVCIDIKYEDLLASPQKELEKILSQLGLEFEASMLNYFEQANQVVKGREISWKENLYKPIQQHKIDSWKSSLSKSIVKKVEDALYPEMKILGYAFESRLFYKASLYYLLSKIYMTVKCR